MANWKTVKTYHAKGKQLGAKGGRYDLKFVKSKKRKGKWAKPMSYEKLISVKDSQKCRMCGKKLTALNKGAYGVCKKCHKDYIK